MKKLALFVFCLLTVITGCCMQHVRRDPSVKFISEIKSDTVALVNIDKDGDVATYCSGVWVGPDTILTADHCAQATIMMSLGMDEVGDHLAEIEVLEDGWTISYSVDRDYVGVWQKPKATFEAKVIKFDFEHDLALLKVTAAPPQHHAARLARSLPNIGERVHVMGHPIALTWTYIECVVGAYREESFKPAPGIKKGPWEQLVCPIYHGNSGGGAFNNDGELIGIASFMAPAPNQGFFVHLVTISDFLK